LESIAFQVADVLDAMQLDAGTPLPELHVDGGAAVNETLLRFQADILGIPVVRPAVMETTALGAAYMAGIATGFWRDAGEIASMPLEEKRYEPRMSRAQTDALRGRWKEALSRSKRWA
jgi:glycerol kinase